MTLRTKFFLMLLFLSLLMGIGIIIPGYLKLRELELNEATEYALDRSIRMRNEVKQSVDILENAGVADIESYVTESKERLISSYQTAPADPRVNQYILDDDGKILFESNGSFPMPITAELIDKLEHRDNNSMHFSVGASTWLLTAQKHDPWGWHLLSSMSEQEVYRDSRDYLIYVMTISLFVLLFVISLYILMTRQLRRKTRIIMNHLELYKAGRYDKRFQVTGNDEISVLQNSINSMIDSIEIEIESRKTAEKELISRSKKHLLASNQEDADLFTNISIKIKNSINAIIGFSDLLAQSNLNKKQHRYAENISLAGKNLNGFFNEISDHAGIKHTRAEMAKGEFDLESICDSLKSLQVLVINDDKLDSEYICEVLTACKIECKTAHNRKQVVKYFEKNDADLVLLNVGQLENEDGKTIQYIREELQHYLSNIPIIAITSYSAEIYTDYGATAILAKPFNPSQLLGIISRVIEN